MAYPQRRHYVMRLTLQPLQLGHVFLLARNGSPYVSGGDIGTKDLIFAVFVCAQDWRESQKDLKHKLRFRIYCFLWGLFCRRRWRNHMREEVAEFHEYMRFNNEGPSMKRLHGQPPKNSFNGPWFMHAMLALMEAGYSEDQALDMPMTEANVMLATIAERSGNVAIKGEADLDFEAMCDELDRQAEEANKE